VQVIRLALVRGPLCRRSDRVEAAALLTAILLSLAALPLSALAGTAMGEHARAVAVEQTADRRATVATLIEDPEITSLLPGRTASATVTWTTPSGDEHQAAIDVPLTAHLGSEVPVWTSPEGNLTTPPLTASQVEVRAGAAAVGAQLAMMVLVWTVFVAVRRGINRRRHQAWSEEWARVSRGLRS